MNSKRTASALTLALCLLGAGTAQAHGPQPGHAGAAPLKKEQQVFGMAGEATKVGRSIEITMGDDMRFKPSHIRVREGETVRLRIRNHGQAMHELVIGTAEDLDKHAELMKKFPNMEHEEAHMAHVPPGSSGEIVWHFNRAGQFDFACLIAGHFQAGMRGLITVTPRSKKP